MKKFQREATSKFGPGWQYMLAATLIFTVPPHCLAQDESPLPGNNSNNIGINSQSSAGQVSTNSTAPVPGNNQSSPSSLNILTSIPPVSKPQSDNTVSEIFNTTVSLSALQTSVQDLKNSGATEDNLNKYLVGLDTLIRAHNKLATTFSKQESTAVACNNEHNLSKQLCLLKDQVLYLKAQILIKENRLCEAVSILADIAAFEPLSALGQQCYTRLIETGFSPKPEAVSVESTVKSHQSPHNPTRLAHSKIRRQMGILAR